MSGNAISSEQVQQFAVDGNLILEKIIDADLVELVLRIAKEDPGLRAEVSTSRNFEDDRELPTRLVCRTEFSDDAFGALARSALLSPAGDGRGTLRDACRVGAVLPRQHVARFGSQSELKGTVVDDRRLCERLEPVRPASM